MRTYDVLIVGGGPAGSACARVLARAGVDVAVVDASRFPRDKLCAGWLSPPVFDVLALRPGDYPHGLWEWRRAHVHHRGHRRTVPVHGYFIRRAELDAFLLSSSGATVIEGTRVRDLARAADGCWSPGHDLCARVVVGAGGSRCPVARSVGVDRRVAPVAALEREGPCSPEAQAARRAGADGEPELYLHADLRGYSWNVPKGGWWNVGCGTSTASAVRAAWADTRRAIDADARTPPDAPWLDHPRGHTYALFDERHLAACEDDGRYLVGDALGLAHPLTAEGILPAIVSGTLCAGAILDGTPGRYREAVASHPLFVRYRRMSQVQRVAARMAARLRSTAGGAKGAKAPTPGRAAGAWIERRAAGVVAYGFARLFEGGLRS